MQHRVKAWLHSTTHHNHNHNGRRHEREPLHSPKIYIPRGGEDHESTPSMKSSLNQRTTSEQSPVLSTPAIKALSQQSSKPITDINHPNEQIPPHRHDSTGSQIGSDMARLTPAGSLHVTASNASKPSLGGNPSMMPHTAMLKHNEDIADRNIEGSNHLGSGSPSHTHSPVNADESGEFYRAKSVSSRSNAGQSATSASVRKPSLTGSTHGGGSGRYISEESVLQPDGNQRSSQQREQYMPSRTNRQRLVARDESRINLRQRRHSADSTDDLAPRASDYGPRMQSDRRRSSSESDESRIAGDKQISLIDIIRAGPGGDGASEDVDRMVAWAPAVSKTRIHRPVHHEITQHVHRDIHNYDEYYHIQPVIDTEILPPKHYTLDQENGTLHEISPDCVPPDSQEYWFTEKVESDAPRRRVSSLPKPFLGSFSRDSGVDIDAESSTRNAAAGPDSALNSLPETLKSVVDSIPGTDGSSKPATVRAM